VIFKTIIESLRHFLHLRFVAYLFRMHTYRLLRLGCDLNKLAIELCIKFRSLLFLRFPNLVSNIIPKSNLAATEPLMIIDCELIFRKHVIFRLTCAVELLVVTICYHDLG